MKADDGFWNKLTRLVIALLLVAGLLGIAVWYLPLIRQNERMGHEVQRLDNELRKEGEIRKQLDSSISALRSDSNAVARLVREKMGYAKPGETVFRFENPGTNSSATP